MSKDTSSKEIMSADGTEGACTMMLAEQTQGYRISLELTKPNQSSFTATIINFLCQLRLDPELMERLKV